MVAQRQTDLDGSSNLYLLATGVQQDADGCHGFQINTSENCKTVHARNVNGKAYCLGTSIKKSSIHLQSHTFQFLLGNAETIPGQTRYIISPAGSGSTPGSPSSWVFLENLQRQAPKKHPNQIPKPPKVPHPIPEAEPNHPTEEAYLSPLHFESPCC